LPYGSSKNYGSKSLKYPLTDIDLDGILRVGVIVVELKELIAKLAEQCESRSTNHYRSMEGRAYASGEVAAYRHVLKLLEEEDK